MKRFILLSIIVLFLSACSDEKSQIDQDIENSDKQIINLERRINDLKNENKTLTEKKKQKQEQLTALEKKAKEENK